MGWIDFGIFLNLFFNGHVLFKGKLPFEFYDGYAPLIILLIVFIAKYRFPRETLYILIPLLITGLLNVFLDNNTFNNLFKIFANVAVNLIFYRYVITYYNYDVKRIFRVYLHGALIVSLLGLFQWVSYLVGFTYGYEWTLWSPLNKWGVSPGGLGIRINSTLSEPSYFGTIIAPAFFFCAYQLFKGRENYLSRTQNIIIVVTYLISLSSLAILGVFISILLIAVNFGLVRYIALAIPISLLLFFISYKNVKEFQERIDGMQELFVDKIIEKEMAQDMDTRSRIYRAGKLIPRIHGSSFVLYNNYHVALKNFRQNPLFGSGLGSHELAYQKYKLNYLLGGIYEFNTTDANSMLLRTISEVGLMGLLFVLFFLFKFYISKNLAVDEDEDYWLISNALLILIIIQLLRQGNYTFSGFFLYAWMYYFLRLQYQEYLDKKLIDQQNEMEAAEEENLNNDPV